MKKLIALALIITLALPASAQRTLIGSKNKTTAQVDNSAYMAGAVPEINGKVTFTQTINAPDKSKAELCKALSSWASLRFMPETESGIWSDPAYYKNLENSAVKLADPLAGKLICYGNEEQVFSNRILAKDFTVINYTLNIDVKDGQVVATMTDIVYSYALSDEPEDITAESWITDAEAITKKGKLMKVSGKFRIKTIDVKDQLFKDIAKAIQ